MRFYYQLAAAVAAMAAGGPPIASLGIPPTPVGDEFFGLRDGRRSKGKGVRRGNGHQAKPKRRPNRLTISRHVRRKHRRAA